MGKTGTVLALIDLMQMTGELTGPVLVLGPKRVARDVWVNEAKKWDDFRHLTVRAVIGTQEKRIQALRSKKADIYCINYENIAWLIEACGDTWPFQMVVADESTRLKSLRGSGGSKRAKALSKIAQKSRYWFNLTGTPSPNGLLDLWGQNYFVDNGARLGNTFTAFKQRWFRVKPGGWGIEPMPGSDTRIHEAMKDCSLTLDAKDWFDIQLPIETRVEIELPPDARKHYNELERKLYTELQSGKAIEVFNDAALTNKCAQLASGAVYDSDGKWHAVHDEKLEALESLLEEINGPILVAYQFVSEANRIVERFGAKKVALISKKTEFKRFCDGDALIALAHPASVGHGVNGLEYVTNVLVRYGHGWSLEERAQMIERIGPTRQAQAGFNREVRVYDIVAKNTIDEDIIARQDSKASIQKLLLDSCKRRLENG